MKLAEINDVSREHYQAGVQTADEIEVAWSLNFSILVECCLLKACDGVDFVSSTGFRGSRYFRRCLRWI